MAKANGDDVSIAEFQAYLDKLFGALGPKECLCHGRDLENDGRFENPCERVF